MAVGKPFEKGKSGNPGGRPKENPEVKQLARAHTVEAVNRLAEWMRSDNAKASVSACNALLARGWGAPTQAIEHSGDGGGPLQAVLNVTIGPKSAPVAKAGIGVSKPSD